MVDGRALPMRTSTGARGVYSVRRRRVCGARETCASSNAASSATTAASRSIARSPHVSSRFAAVWKMDVGGLNSCALRVTRRKSARNASMCGYARALTRARMVPRSIGCVITSR